MSSVLSITRCLEPSDKKDGTVVRDQITHKKFGLPQIYSEFCFYTSSRDTNMVFFFSVNLEKLVIPVQSTLTDLSECQTVGFIKVEGQEKIRNEGLLINEIDPLFFSCYEVFILGVKFNSTDIRNIRLPSSASHPLEAWPRMS